MGRTESTERNAEHDDGVPHTSVHRLVRRFIEPAQDVLVVLLMLALLAIMIRTLGVLAKHILGPHLEFRPLVGEVLFMLVMIEMVRLLILYLHEHHVAVDVMVELSLVSTLREVVLTGVVEFQPTYLLALAVFVLALGFLLRFGDLRVPVGRGRPRGGGASADVAGNVPAPPDPSPTSEKPAVD
jgi:uncharacterized membrane protein (DUF373 family)